MTAFPDLVVQMDRLIIDGAGIEYHWTLMGTNTAPGGTGNSVRISGYEEWRFGVDGLIDESKGHFNKSEYDRQLNATLMTLTHLAAACKNVRRHSRIGRGFTGYVGVR